MKTLVTMTLACMIALTGAASSVRAQAATGSPTDTVSVVAQDPVTEGDPAPRETLRFVIGHNPPYSTYDQTGIIDRLLVETFRRAGIGLNLRKVPLGRAGILVNSGVEDACGPRIAAFSKHFPNLVRVDEPVITFEMVAYTNQPGIDDFSQNNQAGYTVGHVFGAIMLDQIVKGFSGTTMKLRNPRQVLQLLQQGRIDIAIAERWTGLEIIKSLKLKGVRALPTPLQRKPAYFFIHRDYAHLAPRIAQALGSIKSDGTYAKIMARSLSALQQGF
ncbi:transporter substrate-binding domain-containing protein [Breoghania sp.]|uniref:substrate-binding periplasmic protein n=1 Tax=Breoghania sp. TaxID=2065378 RepID=UPI002AAC3F78|nr:transporter substrate-binding domain-containing protein [Breoghania sp.]